MNFGEMAQAYIVQTTPAPVATTSPGDAIVDAMIGAAEIGGMGMAMGYLNATSPAEGKSYHESFGYPTDLLVAGAGISLGLIMLLFGSKNFAHPLRLGLGALIEAGVRTAMEKGVESREASDKKQITAGQKKNLRLVDRQPVSSITKPASQGVFQPVV